MKRIKYFLLVFIFACASDEDRKVKNISIVQSPIKITIEKGNNNLILGDTLYISTSLTKELSFSKIDVFLNDTLISSPESLPFNLSVPTTDSKLGKNQLRISLIGGEKIESKSMSFVVFSDIVPKQYTYKVINQFPHNQESYTQGLLYHDGFLYEGTGQKGLSRLLKLDIETGKTIESRDLDDNIFGEGIVLHQGNLLQLSWMSQVGFVYDIKTFEEINRFYYQGEGWGLASDGEKLYRSDGSHTIFVHSSSGFAQESEIEIYSNEGPIKWLNELEFIDGKIYANIWQQDEIAIINPSNGKCEAIINLKGLLPKSDRSKSTDVLNGIAYDLENDRLFVTGKYWSKLFEIKIIEKSVL